MTAKKKVTTDPTPATPASGADLPVDHPSAPPRRVVVEGLQAKYATEWSVADSIYSLMYWCGWNENDASRTIIAEYLSAFERNDGSVFRQSWVELATTIMRNARPGLFERRGPSRSGDASVDQSGLPSVPTRTSRRGEVR